MVGWGTTEKVKNKQDERRDEPFSVLIPEMRYDSTKRKPRNELQEYHDTAEE